MQLQIICWKNLMNKIIRNLNKFNTNIHKRKILNIEIGPSTMVKIAYNNGDDAIS
jgi:hypothetical protein